MARPTENTPVTEVLKAQVMAMVTAGQGGRAIEKATGLKPYQISRIKGSMSKEEIQQGLNTRKDEFEDLLIHYIKESLTTLALQVRHFGDKDWLQRQSADSLAVLHGVCVDKAVRLLEALQPAEPGVLEEEPSGEISD